MDDLLPQFMWDTTPTLHPSHSTAAVRGHRRHARSTAGGSHPHCRTRACDHAPTAAGPDLQAASPAHVDCGGHSRRPDHT